MGAAWKEGERRNCSACGVPCVGAKSKHGSVGPIELEPNANGNVLLFKGSDGELRYAVLPRKHDDPVRRFVLEHFMPLRMNHFATCPRAEEFRRGGAASGKPDTTNAGNVAAEEDSNASST